MLARLLPCFSPLCCTSSITFALSSRLLPSQLPMGISFRGTWAVIPASSRVPTSTAISGFAELPMLRPEVGALLRFTMPLTLGLLPPRFLLASHWVRARTAPRQTGGPKADSCSFLQRAGGPGVERASKIETSPPEGTPKSVSLTAAAGKVDSLFYFFEGRYHPPRFPLFFFQSRWAAGCWSWRAPPRSLRAQVVPTKKERGIAAPGTCERDSCAVLEGGSGVVS